ncbi:MAG: AraC-like DNA-binding protein [Flavobacteriales bacterium]|jgi:AraC-like DNA-binding protein
MLVIIEWAIGFSIIAIPLFGLFYFFALECLHKTFYAKTACSGLLLILAVLQICHWYALTDHRPLLDQSYYIAILFAAPAAFYLFVREVLIPDTKVSLVLLLHFTPCLIALVLTGPIAVTLAFLIGMGYGVWLCRLIYQLKDQRKHFNAEFYLLLGFVITALAALIVGLGAPIWGERTFILAYATLTAAFIAISLFLFLKYPGIGAKAEEAVQRNYAVSTLKQSNTAHLKARLDQLLNEQKVYRNETLSLSGVADLMSISAHQLSELVNTLYGVGFSRLLRSCRVGEAKTLLLAEPDASVLSISMMVGFSSQSNFYTAFREIEGQTPGQYRKVCSK